MTQYKNTLLRKQFLFTLYFLGQLIIFLTPFRNALFKSYYFLYFCILQHCLCICFYESLLCPINCFLENKSSKQKCLFWQRRIAQMKSVLYGVNTRNFKISLRIAHGNFFWDYSYVFSWGRCWIRAFEFLLPHL